MKRLVLLAVLATSVSAVPFAGAAGRTTTVGVKASEFKFVLTTKTVRKGTVVFRVKNVGKIPHDFEIARRKSAILMPGKSATIRVRFAKAGRYPYRCTLPGHAAAGMKGVLRVR